jgi:hypothetical protein
MIHPKNALSSYPVCGIPLLVSAYRGYEAPDLADCFYSFLKVIVRSLRWIHFNRQNPKLMPLSLK